MNLVHPEIDAYLGRFAAHANPVLLEMEERAARENFPIVGPQVGRLLEVFARAAGARRVLELGSGFGYSAYWFLRAVGSHGSVTLTEGSPERCAEAAQYLDRGGFAGRFRVETGDALAIAATIEPAVDIVFCDIDKHDYPKALGVARRLLRPGGLFITDNLLWDGNVLAPPADDRTTAGVVELTRLLREANDFATTIVPLRDGVSVAVKTG